jgi:hypothetical protein
MQFSLRDLLILFVFAAIFCWCAAQVGVESGVFWFVVVFSAIISTLFLRAAHRQAYGLSLLAVGAGIGLQFFLLVGAFFSLALVLNLVLLGVLAIYCMSRPPQSFRTTVLGVASCAAISFVAGVIVVKGSVQRLYDLRAEFPIESFEHRLHYEQAHNKSANVSATLATAVNERLKTDAYLYEERSYRSSVFQKLHSRSYESFIRAEGFGIGRISSPRREHMESPPLRDIAFRERLPKDFEGNSWRSDLLHDQSPPLAKLHNISRFDFADPELMGHTIEPRSKIAGFVTHANKFSPPALLESDEKICLHRLELVSLLKYPEPRVYVLDHLPRMDQLSATDAPTRTLNEFEAASLTKLRTAEDLVIDQSQTPVRMLGSLRASNRCLDCHNVQRGELLGAFSYALTMGGN